MHAQWILRILIVLFATCPAWASQTSIPEILQPWQAWVLEDHQDLECPWLISSGHETSNSNVTNHNASSGNERVCLWPSRLEITLEGREARFYQAWRVYAEDFVRLPGGAAHWPVSVTVNGHSIPVVERQSAPAVFLKPGFHQLQGKITLPEDQVFLRIPPESAIVQLKIDGKRFLNPRIDQQGRLWFRQNNTTSQQAVQDQIELKVFRKITDDVPLIMDTHVALNVSGRAREVTLDKILLEGFIPIEILSAMPARLEADGSLRMHVRPGTWVVEVKARSEKPLTTLSSPVEELWVFEHKPGFRQVRLSGLQSIDPAQTRLPQPWKSYMAFKALPGDVLKIETVKGPEEEGANRLSLDRDMWLDFDGEGFTLRDHIRGEMNQTWRLSMQSEITLGKVDINGEPQVITVLEDQDGQGVEVRQTPLDLQALSRIEQPALTLPATGWQEDFQQLTTRLHLPPGWSLLGASGVDSAKGAWLEQWRLWDLFLVLLIVLGIYKTVGVKAALVGLVALVLIYHQPYAPVWVWFHCMLALALLKVVSSHARWLRGVLLSYALLSFLALFVIELRFIIQEVKQGLYPQLSREYSIPLQEPGGESDDMAIAKGQEPARALMMDSLMEKKLSVESKPSVKNEIEQAYFTQTGPGQPYWRWRMINLNWSGPVLQEQTLQLYLISPAWNRLLAVLRVLLTLWLAALLFKALDVRQSLWPSVRKWGLHSAALVLLCGFLVGMLVQPRAYAQMPGPELLDALEKRLTQPPSCLPECLGVQSASMIVDTAQLTLHLEVDALTRLSLPLPAAPGQWMPELVTLNGERYQALKSEKDRQSWMIAVPTGKHRISITGLIIADNEFQVRFPVTMHNVALQANGWEVTGLKAGSIPGQSLHFRRLAVADASYESQDTLAPEPMPVFAKIERHIILGLEMKVLTRVTRWAPERASFELRIPLLSGESVLSDDAAITLEQGVAHVTFKRNQNQISWNSRLARQTELTLTAPEQNHWVETWILEPSALWHVQMEGLKPNQAGWRPEFFPWPGEQVTLTLKQPAVFEGKTSTIEAIHLETRPGLRSTSANLNITLNASKGYDFPLTLPKTARLQSLRVDGVERPVQGFDASGTIPLAPGQHVIELAWLQQKMLSLVEHLPEIDFSAAVSNIQLTLFAPDNRWIIAILGPQVGPVVLYWSVLCVVAVVALLLGRFKIGPVKTWQWLLLSLGLSLSFLESLWLVILWFFLLSVRQRWIGEIKKPVWFNLIQVLLILFSVAALAALISAIPQGLLASPDMGIVGNGSNRYELHWYHDRAQGVLPEVSVVWLPLWVYRCFMLFWSLWLAVSVIQWIKWGWDQLHEGAFWMKKKSEAKEEND